MKHFSNSPSILISPSIDVNTPSIQNKPSIDVISPSIQNKPSIDVNTPSIQNNPSMDDGKVTEKICRICYEDTENNMIEPCKCGGSIRWVHKDCLLKWIDMNSTRNSKCDICKFSYKITKKCTQPLLSSINKHYIRIPIIVIFFSIIVILSVILFNIISGNEIFNISLNKCLYSFRLVTIIGIIGIACYLNYYNLDYNLSNNFYSSNSMILLNFHIIQMLDNIFDNEISKYLSYEYEIENISK